MLRTLLIPAIAATGLALAPLQPAAAGPISTFELENGLEIVVIEDHRAPVAVHMLWYRAGAADEPPGVSGIAHFLEHLLFKATDKIESGAFSRIVEENGGTDNAFTSYDYTAYIQRVAADRLELMMQLEADRMRNLRLTEADIITERDVIIEERNQRTENNPGALFGEQRQAAQYLNHPYAIPIIGWRHEMVSLSLDDALAFYRTHYAPNNAILIVAGDVVPNEVLAMAQRHYGPLEPTIDLPQRIRPQEPPQTAPRRLTFEDPRVGQDYVIRTYLAPERDSGDQRPAAALVLLAELLGGSGITSFMGERLQLETQRAVYSAAFYSGTSYDDTTFGVIVVPSAGRSLTDSEADMDEVIAAFLETGVDLDQLARIKMQIRAADIYADDSTQGLARRYGAALTSGLTIEDIEAWPDILQSITEDEIMEAARNIFDMEKSVTGWLMKPAPVEEATE
jgi:zinc protease